jgi:hypothetical protein
VLITALLASVEAKAFGGYDFDWATCIVYSRGFAILGETYSFGQGKSDIILLRFDSSGVLERARVFGYDGEDYGRAMLALSDGGYIIAGEIYDYTPSGRDILLLRVDSLCEPVWARSYAGPDWEWAEDMALCPDLGYVLVGMTTSSGGGDGDIAILRTDSIGGLLWARTYGGPGAQWGIAVAVDPEGNIIAIGNSLDGIIILSLSQAGALRWARLLLSEPRALSVSCGIDPQGGIVILGDADSDMILIKMSPRGDVIWARRIGTPGDDRPLSLAFDREGRIILFSFATEDTEAMLSALNEDGESLWTKGYRCPGFIWDGDMAPRGDNGWVIAAGMRFLYADDILILSVSGESALADCLRATPADLSVESPAGVLLRWSPETRAQELVDMTPKLKPLDISR